MGFIFKKLNTGEIVSSSGGKVFRKLSVQTVTPPVTPPIIVPGLYPDNFDLNILGLSAGTYTITATTEAEKLKLKESKRSNSVEYKVE